MNGAFVAESNANAFVAEDLFLARSLSMQDQLCKETSDRPAPWTVQLTSCLAASPIAICHRK